MGPLRAPSPFYEITCLSGPDVTVLDLLPRFAETRSALPHDLVIHPGYPGSTSPCAIRSNRRTASFRETSQNLWIAMKEY
jgi:hypothetical protein